LFQSLVNEAHDARDCLMREAAGRATSSRAELVEVLSVLQQFGPQSHGQARRPSC